MITPGPNITLDLAERAARDPASPALILSEGVVTSRELDLLGWQSAQFLHDHGVRSGDVVALTFVSDFLLIAAILGLARLGATNVVLARGATAHERRQWARAAGAKVLASDAPDRHETALPAIAVSIHDVRHQGRVDTAILDEHPRSPALIAVGSGSTGQPKLIPMRHAQIRSRARLFDFAPDDRILSLPSLEFSSTICRFFGTLADGGAYVLYPAETVSLVRLVADYRATILTASVFHMETMLQSAPPGRSRHLASLRGIRVSSSTVTDRLRAKIREHMSENLHVGYGTNETGPVSRVQPPDVYAISGGVGAASAGVEVEIVDGRNHPVAPGEVGEMRVRCAGTCDGYLGDEVATAERFRDGWFHTGDLARFERGANIVHCGRADQMMIMDGINIYPTEIEQCLASNPLVEDAVALPMRHEIHQEIPVCAVSLASGAAISAASLQAYAAERLGLRSPKRVIVVDRIPRNAQGKVVRADLIAKIRDVQRR